VICSHSIGSTSSRSLHRPINGQQPASGFGREGDLGLAASQTVIAPPGCDRAVPANWRQDVGQTITLTAGQS
jgi:hypothetical protein